ncbi:MAG: ABC transporter permease [Sporolactobacillus sp.]
MEELNDLWRRRCRDNFSMQLRYWNLISKNSGLMFFVYAMLLAGAFYYKQWLDSLPPQFPSGWLLAAGFTALVIVSPIRTFLHRADTVFLLAAEGRMAGYFVRSCIYSFAVQSLLLAGCLVIGAPLYFHGTGANSYPYGFITLVLFIVKAWNVYVHWLEQRIEDVFPFVLLRCALTFLLLEALFNAQPWVMPLTCFAVMVIATFILYRRQASTRLLNWERLLSMENREAMHFLRFANLFTDVPQLRRHVRERRWLTRWFPVRLFDQADVFRQLFIKTFCREDDYFGLSLRLTLIGIVTIYFLAFGPWTALISASFVYLTGLQLLPLWRHPFPQALEGMYPVARAQKKTAFIQFLFYLLSGESVILTVAASFSGIGVESSGLVFIAAMAISLLCAFRIAPSMIEKEGH